jgi:DNA-binding MarR family transcriptional regulator
MTARISYLIKWVERGVRSGLDTILQPMGVTTPEYTALSVLRHRSGLSSAQLARRAFVSAQAMNQIVVSLERAGWIERTPDPDNGRILRAELTREGRTVLSACDKATAQVERTLLSQLSEAQAQSLRATLELCANALTEASPRNRADD